MDSNSTSPDQGPPKTSPLAIASLVCGIVGIILFGIVLGPLAIIFGAIAINRINDRPHEFSGSRMAKSGIICGVVAIVIYIVLVILLVNSQP